MFDQDYFRITLARDVEAAGGHPVIEIQLSSGHSHRIRSVLDVGAVGVTFEAYQAKGDLAHERPRFGEATPSGGSRDTYRAVIAYGYIVAVILDPSSSTVRARPGFASA